MFQSCDRYDFTEYRLISWIHIRLKCAQTAWNMKTEILRSCLTHFALIKTQTVKQMCENSWDWAKSCAKFLQANW